MATKPRALIFFIILTMISASSIAKSLLDTLLQKEMREYRQDKWCEDHGGQARQVLPDQRRIECLTDTHAITFEVGPKWAEAMGRALHYGLKSNKRPGMVLVIESGEDQKHWSELKATIQHYNLPIDTWKLEK